ncbi:PH domain-containing protein [Streptomyces sodiiphilus]|uniref:PH domain-containing protein n=1 Tax=Streptomyces sodiiphilus TaxID=226217 RepID=A0ABN2NYN1_9ACTN
MTSEPQPQYADRRYRSGSALAAGVLLLGLMAWMGGDAILRGEGRMPLTAAAALLFLVPLVVAFTLRPVVLAGDRRIRVRNPFRTISAPWGSVETVRAGYSCELLADGSKYQLWSIPVSLRARGKANRHNQRLAAGQQPRTGPFGLGGVTEQSTQEQTAPSDIAVAELRELAERHHGSEDAQGPVTVRWAWEILAPLGAGAVALLLVWLTS